MERVVEEIFAIAPYLPAADAQALLVRADSLIRPEPCVPDAQLPTAVRGKLLKLLRLRANLPATLQGNALQELKAMLLQTPTQEFLDNFNAWDAEPLLSYFCDQRLEWMQRAARRRGSVIHADILERELASRLAHCLPQSLGKLWQFVLSLSSEDPGVWLEGAALVLATFHSELQVKFRDLPPALLDKAIRCLQCREASALQAQSLFKAALGFRFQPDPMSYLAFADQLAASELLEQAARVGIVSARAFDTLGNKDASHQAYSLAYGWDRNNVEALQGLSAGAASGMRIKKNFFNQKKLFPIKKKLFSNQKKLSLCHTRKEGSMDERTAGRKEGREEGRKEGKKEGEKREGGRKEGRKARRGRKEGRKEKGRKKGRKERRKDGRQHGKEGKEGRPPPPPPPPAPRLLLLLLLLLPLPLLLLLLLRLLLLLLLLLVLLLVLMI